MTDTVADTRGSPVDESVTVPVVFPFVTKVTVMLSVAVLLFVSVATAVMVFSPSSKGIDAVKVLLLTDD